MESDQRRGRRGDRPASSAAQQQHHHHHHQQQQQHHHNNNTNSNTTTNTPDPQCGLPPPPALPLGGRGCCNPCRGTTPGARSCSTLTAAWRRMSLRRFSFASAPNSAERRRPAHAAIAVNDYTAVEKSPAIISERGSAGGQAAAARRLAGRIRRYGWAPGGRNPVQVCRRRPAPDELANNPGIEFNASAAVHDAADPAKARQLIVPSPHRRLHGPSARGGRVLPCPGNVVYGSDACAPFAGATARRTGS